MLLAENREVYLPAVDDHGVDLIVRSNDAGYGNDGFSLGRYQEIQVKSLREGGLFAAITCDNPRPEYWFVFHVVQHNAFWLINSMDFVKLASRNSSTCKNTGKYSISLATAKGIRQAMAQFVVTNFSKLP